MKNIKFTFLIIVSLLTISCGFHLRGSQDLSAVLPEVNLQGVSPHSEVGRELIHALSNAKVNVSDETSTVLNVTQNSFSKRVLSLDNAGRANQYELKYTLKFSLVKVEQLSKKEQEDKSKLIDLIPAQHIAVKREYLFNADLILVAEDEERRLKGEMIKSSVLQIIRRLSFSLKSKNNLAK